MICAVRSGTCRLLRSASALLIGALLGRVALASSSFPQGWHVSSASAHTANAKFHFGIAIVATACRPNIFVRLAKGAIGWQRVWYAVHCSTCRGCIVCAIAPVERVARWRGCKTIVPRSTKTSLLSADAIHLFVHWHVAASIKRRVQESGSHWCPTVRPWLRSVSRRCMPCTVLRLGQLAFKPLRVDNEDCYDYQKKNAKDGTHDCC